MKLKGIYKIFLLVVFSFVLLNFFSCKKDKLITDSSARIHFSQDSVLFDTVFTSIGSATKNIRIRNENKQKINISYLQLVGGSASSFIINVDGEKGTSFKDIEIAANDSIYIFIQVNINPNNLNSPFIITDKLEFTVNGNKQTVHLEAWGQNAYYHRPNKAIKFQDGSYLAYSLISEATNTTISWANDKPHVVYGYLVVDSTQKLIINAGTKVYMNYKAGLWVYRYGEINVLGEKGNEVVFQGARGEAEYADEPGQWDRIWINEGSVNNIINYAIIKNAYIGVQAELFGNDFSEARRLKITNTIIQNMSMWGLYSLGYNIYAGNNVISNCMEHSVNLLLGGKYTFIHCTFANYWEKDGTREKPTLFVNNHTPTQVLPLDSCYFGNCIIDGKLTNEISLDLQNDNTFPPKYQFSNCWMKTTNDVSDANLYVNCRTGTEINYISRGTYYFAPKADEVQVKGFIHLKATEDALKFPFDINNYSRPSGTVTIGAYESN